MNEVSMWLYPVVVAAFIGLIMAARFGLAWTYGICLQQVLILVISAVGFMYLYGALTPPPTVPREHLAMLCAIIAWIVFFVFNIGQRIVLNKLSLDLSMFRVQGALDRRHLVRLLVWGPPGAYWSDMAVALNFYNMNQPAQADDILNRWMNDKRMPLPAKESLVGFFMLGRVMLHDWNGIITQFEENQNALAVSRTFVPYQLASRAYAEMGRYSEAAECLEKANMQPTKTSTTNLDINFMTIFALFGAIEPLRRVLTDCKDFRALPQYVRDYWLGRCHAVCGDAVRAVSALRDAQSRTPNEMNNWHSRIQSQIVAQEAKLVAGVAANNSAPDQTVERTFRLYERLRSTVEILRPGQTRPGVLWLVILLTLSYVATNIDTTFHHQAYSLGELSAKGLLKFQWWRAISYMLLHGNLPHLLMNTFALYLFGKFVENTYGTYRFMIIFLGSGIVSGILQVAIVPQDTAIGASGAILGIFGAAIAGIMKMKNILPESVRRSELKFMVSIAVAQVVFDQLINGVAALTDKSETGVRIASFAHMFGMIVGFVIGMILKPRSIDRR